MSEVDSFNIDHQAPDDKMEIEETDSQSVDIHNVNTAEDMDERDDKTLQDDNKRDEGSETSKKMEYIALEKVEEEIENHDTVAGYEDSLNENDDEDTTENEETAMGNDKMECNKMEMSENPVTETTLDNNSKLRIAESDGQGDKANTQEYRPPIKIKMKELFKKRARPRKSAKPQRVVKEAKVTRDLYDGDTDEEYWYDDKHTTSNHDDANKDPDFTIEDTSTDMAYQDVYKNEDDGHNVSDMADPDAEISEVEDDESGTDDEFKKYAKNLKKSYEFRMAQKLCEIKGVETTSTGRKNIIGLRNKLNKKLRQKSKLKIIREKVKRTRLDRRRPHGIVIPEPIMCEVAPGQSQVEMWKCDLCTKLCKNAASYIAHYKSCLEKSKTEVYSNDDGKFKCTDCGKVYELKASLQRHMRFHQGIEKYKCPICDRQFTDSKSLRGHVFIHTGEKPYKCSVCGFPFRDKSTWRKHERRHGTEKPFECATCKKCFFHGVDLRKHEKIHLTDKEYKCTQCDKQFYLIGALKRHERVHTGERPYFCSICCKAFTDTTAVRCHERTHTNIRPFKCDACDMTFAFKNHLDRHTRNHNKGKPFRCEFCFQEFADKAVLQDHKTRHNGDEPYECTVCSLTFSDSNVLRTHRKIHVLEKSFACPVCGKNFSRNYALKRHVDQMHSADRPQKKPRLKGVRKGNTAKRSKTVKGLVDDDVIQDANMVKTEVLVKDIPHISMIQLALAGASPPKFNHLRVETGNGTTDDLPGKSYSERHSEIIPSVSPTQNDASPVEEELDNGNVDTGSTGVTGVDKHAANYWKHEGHQFVDNSSTTHNNSPLFVPPHMLLSSGFASKYQHLARQGGVTDIANLYKPDMTNSYKANTHNLYKPDPANLYKPDVHSIHNDMLNQLDHVGQNELQTGNDSKVISDYSDYIYRKHSTAMDQETMKGHAQKSAAGYSNDVAYNDVPNYSEHFSAQSGSNHSMGDVAVNPNVSATHQLGSLDDVNKTGSLTENHFKTDWSVMYPSNNC